MLRCSSTASDAADAYLSKRKATSSRGSCGAAARRRNHLAICPGSWDHNRGRGVLANAGRPAPVHLLPARVTDRRAETSPLGTMELSPGIIVEYGHNGKQTAERGCATRAQAGGDPIGQGRTPPRRHTLDGLIHERRGQVHDGPACLREHLPDRALRDVDELGQVDSEDRLKSVLLYSVNGEDAVLLTSVSTRPYPATALQITFSATSGSAISLGMARTGVGDSRRNETAPRWHQVRIRHGSLLKQTFSFWLFSRRAAPLEPRRFHAGRASPACD